MNFGPRSLVEKKEMSKIYLADGSVRDVKEGTVPLPLAGIVIVLSMALGLSLGVGLRPAAKTAAPATIEWHTVSPVDEERSREAYRQERAAEELREAQKQIDWNRRPHLAAPDDPPPQIIKVGPYFYAVHWTSAAALRSQNALALTVLEQRSIWLDPKRTASLRDDLLHELMHCARDLGTSGGGLTGSSDEEALIESTSAGILGILQDNPKLVRWLRKEGR